MTSPRPGGKRLRIDWQLFRPEYGNTVELTTGEQPPAECLMWHRQRVSATCTLRWSITSLLLLV